MDRPTIRTEADARNPAGRRTGDFLPASRRDLIISGLTALKAGPVLITGDAGVGKTWLVERWVGAVASCRWVRVDLTPDDPPALLHRQIMRGLGLLGPGAQTLTRCEIAEALAERSLDGERFGLIVDEAHNLSPGLWEEVRVLLNRIGTDDGFAHLILVGQTALVRRFAARSLGAVEARLAAHLHLRPLDLAETRAWLTETDPDRAWRDLEVETLHRDSGGNPARLRRRLAHLASAVPAPHRVASPPPEPITDASARGPVLGPSSAEEVNRPPLTGPTRPPLHCEENAIEVGWSGDEVDPAPDPDEDEAVPENAPNAGVVRLDETDQAVHDHYAALQAWREWATNQTQRQAAGPPRTDRELADEIDRAAEAEASDFFNETPTPRALTRTESHAPEPFAPFGALFARMPRGVDSEPPRI